MRLEASFASSGLRAEGRRLRLATLQNDAVQAVRTGFTQAGL